MLCLGCVLRRWRAGRRWCSGRRRSRPPASRPRSEPSARPIAGVAVAPLVFRASEGPAAREARRPHFVRRRASKPARALQALRRPPHQWGLVCWRVLGLSARCPARPRRPRALQPGPTSAPQASSPALASHIPEPTLNVARNSPMAASMFELCSLELQRFGTLLKLHPIELRAIFLGSGRIGACWRRRRSPLARCAVV